MVLRRPEYSRTAAMDRLVVVLLLVSILCNINADSSVLNGNLTIRFLRYENEAGTGANGHCCDGRWGICQRNGCDHKFTICLDTTDNPLENTDTCTYGKIQTEEIANQNLVEFGSSFGGNDNPFSLFYERSPNQRGKLSLKIVVMDDDDISGDEFVDFLHLELDYLWNTWLYHFYSLHNRTVLDLEIRSACTQNYYGGYCGSFCPPPKEGQHYYCDESRGKVCLQGWGGPNCTDDTSLPDNRNCWTLKESGQTEDGVYDIAPKENETFRVYCDMSSMDAGVVIHRRFGCEENFNRSWVDYRNGFGDLNGDFWLGLEKMRALLTQQRWNHWEDFAGYNLVVKLQDFDGNEVKATYHNFDLAPEEDNYRLSVDDYDGTAGDAYQKVGDNEKNTQNGMAFTTYDRHNDNCRKSCAVHFGSGNWFNCCFWSNLNGPLACNTRKNQCTLKKCLVWNYDERNSWHFYQKASMVMVPTVHYIMDK